MNTMKSTALALRLAALLGSSAFFAASPVTVQFDGVSVLPHFALSAALASNSGSGGDDDQGGDDHGGSDGHDGGDDDDDDDDDDGDDDSDDDGDNQGGGTDDGSTGGSAGEVVKIETSASGIEVTFGDGSKEEIENGRYERKDSTGRTVEERAATQADFDRLSALF